MKLKVEVKLPEGFRAEKKNDDLVITNGGESLCRTLPRRKLDVRVASNKIELSVATKQDRALVGTFASHFRNMIAGLESPFVYKLKVCSSHFPMSVKKEGSKLIIQNFMGSSAAKIVKLIEGVDVSVAGDYIFVKSADVEIAGRIASAIERTTHLSKKDRRIFQDGVFIVEKAGREVKG